MKRFNALLLGFVALFHVELRAQAVLNPQVPGVYTLGGFNGGTNNIPYATTNTPGSSFAVSDYSSVDLQITLRASPTNATGITFYLARSLDGTTYETTPTLSCAITPNGTNEVSKLFTLSIANAGVLKLTHIANTSADTNHYVTNIAVKYRLKPTRVSGR